jgi:hypothetical protein
MMNATLLSHSRLFTGIHTCSGTDTARAVRRSQRTEFSGALAVAAIHSPAFITVGATYELMKRCYSAEVHNSLSNLVLSQTHPEATLFATVALPS